jgi:MOSC domain-containing protein YiiM
MHVYKRTSHPLYNNLADIMAAKIIAVCTSEKKETKKINVGDACLKENYGIAGDAHSSQYTHRQISLLAVESISKMRDMGLNVNPGDFAENLTTEGIDLVSLPIGANISIGEKVVLEITQIGKECHTRCAIYYQAGDCIMPKEGIFARVLTGGRVKIMDKIEII